jgi:calcineurin-like phosphoesterase family protein
MSIAFVSDLHLGHRTVLRHSAEAGAPRGGSTVEEHDAWVIERCLSIRPNKRTLWYMTGDVAMDAEKLGLLDEIPGRKILVLGNHDRFPTATYLQHFERVVGGFKKYGFWITHIPVHPDELRGHKNLHGHCHHHTLRNDRRYYNCALEWLPDQRPVTLDELRQTWLVTEEAQ